MKMNEERYILARFVQELKKQNRETMENHGYTARWNFGELCEILEQIRSDAVLGEEVQ